MKYSASQFPTEKLSLLSLVFCIPVVNYEMAVEAKRI